MGREARWTRLAQARAVAHATAVALLAGLLVVVTPTAALAAQVVLFNRPFTTSSVGASGTVGTVSVPTASGTNRACLTASGNTSTGPLLSCTGTTDAAGSGTLRLTAASGSQVGGIFGAESVPTTQGIEATFTTYQYGGSSADGMSFVLAAVDPTTQVPPAATGPSGGSLGYSPGGGGAGLDYGYMGIGLDVYGNFSSPSFQGSGCATTTNMTTRVQNAVAVRGPGHARVGYCGLNTTYTGVTTSAVALRTATSTRSTGVPVQVLINPGATTFTATNGQSVAAGSYKVLVTPVGTTTPRTLSGTLPTVAAGLYPAGYLTSGGVPRQLAFGLFASTGGQTDVHEVRNLRVSTFDAVPELGVTTTSYAAATPGAGGPVNYVITPTVSGVALPGAVTVTQTVPTGVSIEGGFGSGWTCANPVGQKITCTTTGSSFAAGTTLPAINVVGIATSASVTSTSIRDGSPTTVTADSASAGTSATATAGTRPTAPSGITLSPNKGTIAGGDAVTIAGANITGATAVHVGTTAEQQAGTPVTLLPCSTVITTSCFTVSGGNLVVSSWPARSTAASVTVTVQTLGIAGTAGYTYASVPDTPDAPVASGGADRVDLSWTTPSDGGSAITGYVITLYRDGATTGTNFNVGVRNSVGFTGVTPGASYTFTIAATNANGTSAPSARSNAAVPYTLPAAPAITGATAGTESATLSWSAPASDGSSAITGYVVTPYVNGVAQAPQTFSGAGTTRTVTGLTAGTAYTFTVAAQNAAGTGPPSAASTAVTPNVSPSLTFPEPPAGQVGVAYNRPLTVTDGTSPFTWSVSAGSLPPGLTLNPSTGLLGGTPTAAGSYTFTVRVVDASGQSATRQVTLSIAAAPALTFSPAAGEVAVPYRQTASVSGGTGPYTWSVRSGALPAGVSLDPSTGVVSGTPTASGSFPVTLAVQDSFGQSATRTATIVIAAVPTFTFTAPPTARVGVAYSTSLTVSGGTAPLEWFVAAGALPAGLTLDASTGVVSGTPTTPRTTSFTIGVVDAFGVDASKNTAITVNPGPVTITKTANVTSVAPGGTVSYTITVANTGTGAFSGVTLSDPLDGVLDDATYNNDAAASSGTVGYAAPTLSWTGNLAAGASATITYSVTVANPVTGNQVLAGRVTSSTLGTTCPAGGTDPRCTSTVTVAGLSVVSSADVATTTPGSTVAFNIVVRNSGQTAYAPASLTQDLTGILDDATYNADVTATLGAATVSGSTLSWSGSLAPGASATIRYTATVAAPGPGNRTLTSLVTSPTAGSVCPSGNPAASCRVSVQVLVPALSITTSTATGPVVPGDRVPYTLTIANTGETPYTGAGVALDLAAVVDDAVLGTFTTTAGTLAFSPTTGVGTWTGDLALGATVTVSGFVTVRNPDPGDRVLTTTTRSSAPGSSCPPGTTSAACATRVEVRVPQLTIAAATDVSSTTPGSTVRHTVTVTNTGETDYAGAVFTQAMAGVLDDATLDGSPSATRGTATYADGAVSWRGDLAVGASATVTYTTTVLDPDPGDRRLTSTVTSTTAFATCPVGGTGPGCGSDVAVLLPSLALTSTANVASTTPGSVVHYTVTAANTGETTYRGITITLDRSGVLDDATSNADAVASTGDLVRRADGALLWTLTLAPGASATTALSVTVRKPAAGDRVLVSTVSAPVQGSSCQPGSSAAGCRLSVPVLLPALEITKTADRATVLPGGAVAYTVTVANTGESVQDGATVVDDLSGLLADVSYDGTATATAGTVSYAEPRLTWTGTLAPGASATFSYTVTVRDPDPGDKQLLSIVVSAAEGSNCAAGSTDPRCVSVVNVTVPELTITNRAGVTSAAPGDRVDLTVTVANTGTSDYAGATISQPLTGLLDDATLTDQPSADTGTASVSGSTLTWTGDLPAGQRATIRYAVTVRAAAGGDNLLRSTVTSPTRGATCPTGGSDPRCSVSVPVARLTLQQSYREPTATPGSVVHLSSTFTNSGQVPYTGISIVIPAGDIVDDLVANGDQVASSGSLIVTADTFTWVGSIAVGETVTVSGTLTVADPDPGNKLVTGTLVTSAPGSNCASGSTDTRCTARMAVLVPQLSITKTASASYVVPGGTAGYTITVANTGQTPYAGATVTDNLSGVLDDATYNADAVASRGSVAYAGPTLTWTGDLAVGESATITYTVTSLDPAPGDKAMANSVSSTAAGSSCRPSSGTAACRATVPVLTPALSITKTADLPNVTLGSAVTYTIQVANTGQVPYSAAQLSDPLAGVLDDATFDGTVTASSGTAAYADQTISWTGALAVGASATLQYTVTTRNPTPGDARLVNTVVSPSTGSNCASGSTDSGCTSTVPVTLETTLTYTKTADVASTTAGSDVTYRVTVRNAATGGDVSGAAFTDDLTGVLDDATANGDATATSGTVSVTGSTLEWEPGAGNTATTATITYSVRVKTAIAGDQVLTGRLTSPQTAVSQNCATGSTDPRCSTRVPVARLEIAQSYLETTTTPGSTVHLSSTYTNTGAYPYEGITVLSPASDILDDAVATGVRTASSGTLSIGPGGLTWTGSIPVGATVTISGDLTVTDSTVRGRVLQGTLVTAAPGSNCGTGSTDGRCTARLPVLVPHLSITKTASASFAVPGGTTGYTVEVRNDGETPYTGAVVAESLAGALDDATYAADAAVTSGSVGYASSTLTWTTDLAVGGSATLTYSLSALTPPPGDKVMVSATSSTAVGSSCPPASGDPACRTVTPVLTPALTLTSTASRASAVPGDAIAYTVTATNTGQVPYPAAAFEVPLADVLDDATLDSPPAASSGTVTVSGGTGSGGTLRWDGSLAVGAQATVTYAVTVRDQPVSHRLVQTVLSEQPGSTCATGSTDPRCTTSVPVAQLHIRNATDVAATQPGATVHYTITFANTGQVDYVGEQVDLDFGRALDDTAYNEDAVATSGELALVGSSGGVTWKGDIPVGTTITITASATVYHPMPSGADGLLVTTSSATAPGNNCAPGSTDPDCRTEVRVLTPQLSITAAADTTTTTPGSVINRTLTITNTGQTAYVGASVADNRAGSDDDASYNGDAVASTGSVTLRDGRDPVWTGDLAVSETVVVRYSVTVRDPAPGDKVLTTVAESGAIGSSCPVGGTSPACRTIIRVLVPALDLSLTPDRSSTTPGGRVTYTLTLTNSGQTPYRGATASVDLAGALDDAAYPGDTTASTGSVNTSGSGDTAALTWTGDLDPGGAAVVTFSLVVAAPDLGDRQLRLGYASAAPGSRCSAGSPCVSVVPVLVPALAVSTIADQTTATPGDAVNFTLTIHNTGETAYGDATVTTALADLLDDAAIEGTPRSSDGTLALTGSTLTWRGSLAVGATVTVTYRARVRAVPGDQQLSATATSAADGSTCPAASPGLACTARVTVLVPALTISKTADAATTTPGSVVRYTIAVRNTGETAYAAASVTDDLTDVLEAAQANDDATVTGGGVVDLTGAQLRWTGSLPVGASATITYSVTVDEDPAGDRVLVNRVTSADPGSSCPAGSTAAACSTSVRVLIPALEVTKTADTTRVVAGEPVRYTVTVVNTGQTEYAPAVVTDDLSGVLDDATYAEDATATTGTVGVTGQTLLWSGALPVGQSATITYSVLTRYPADGDRVLRNAASSPSAGAFCAAAGCATEVDVAVPRLSLAKTADTTRVVAGGLVRYTITATNTGESDYAAATLTDDLAGVLDDGTYADDATASVGAVAVAGGVLTWTGPLERGDSVLVTYAVRVHPTITGDANLVNGVASGTLGSTCPVGPPADGCSVATSVDAAVLSLSGLTDSFTLTGLPGAVVSQDDAVSMRVLTNNPGGYAVTVQGTAAELLPAGPGNPDRIPLSDLGVRPQGSAGYVPLSADTPVVVNRQDGPSGAAGDAVSTDYRVTIPDVTSDTYSTDLEYVVTAQ